MPSDPTERRFLLYQAKAIRRFQRLREPRTREEAQRLALEWIARFAGEARRRWWGHVAGGASARRSWPG